MEEFGVPPLFMTSFPVVEPLIFVGGEALKLMIATT